MIINNFARMRIFEKLGCNMDLESFNHECVKNELPEMEKMEFIGKVTAYNYCKINHPDNIESAMVHLAKFGNTEKLGKEEIVVTETEYKKPCCGGGTVK
jgi:hypothetical protein